MDLFYLLAQSPTLIPTASAGPAASATATPSPTATAVQVAVQSEPFWNSTFSIFVVFIAVLAVGILVGVILAKKGLSPGLAKFFGTFTDMLAYWVVILAFIGIFGLAWQVIKAGAAVSQNKEALDNVKFVFGAILPLLGTWVGTVLAHYFQKENLTAATQSISGLVKTVGSAGKLGAPVKDFMIGPGKIVTLPPESQGKSNAEITLKEVSDHLKKVGLDRLPLFDNNKDSGVVRKIVHLSKIEKYVADKMLSAATPAGGASPSPVAVTTLTLENLFTDVKPDSTFANFTCVKESATLADAKTAMDSMTSTPGTSGNCYDVFITATGLCSEPVIGWITNDIINENAKV